MAPWLGATSYERWYSFKCLTSAAATLGLAIWSVLYMEHAWNELATAFAIYFLYDTVINLGLDAIYKPERQNHELLLLGHHILGIYTMATSPDTDVCNASWKFITVGEFTTPILYLNLWYRFVQHARAPKFTQGLLLALWIPCRFIAPMIAFYRVLIVAEGSCGYVITATPIPYIYMNLGFFRKLLKEFLRDPNAEKKKKDGTGSSGESSSSAAATATSSGKRRVKASTD